MLCNKHTQDSDLVGSFNLRGSLQIGAERIAITIEILLHITFFGISEWCDIIFLRRRE